MFNKILQIISLTFVMTLSQQSFAQKDVEGIFCAVEVANRYKDELKHPFFARDKYKHCSVSCIATVKCDFSSSLAIGVAKELYDIIGPGTADILDMIANLMGIKFGLSDNVNSLESCKKSCNLIYPSLTPRVL